MYRKKIVAWVLLLIFYFEFAGHLYASTHKHYHRSGVPDSSNEVRNNHVNRSYFPSDNVREKIDEAERIGPTQPEMTTFKSVNADNMVNLFTGDFSYSVPLLDVGGYPVNLFYSGGIGMEQEASWVGLGWNINPGTISRNMRGLPDDFDGTDVITKTQSIKPDITVGVSVPISTEVFGFGQMSLNAGVFYNNYRGVGLELGGTANIKINLSKKAADEKTASGADSFNITSGLNAGGGFNLNSQEGMSLHPKLAVNLFNKNKEVTHGLGVGTSYSSRSGITGLQIDAEVQRYGKLLDNLYPGLSGSYPLSVPISFAKPSYVPTIRMPLTRKNISGEFKAGGELWGAHLNVALKGYYSEASIDDIDKVQIKPAVGYLYLEKANTNKDALLDFNRINDNVYTPKTPLISLPYYTYDVFSINGEGTGGTFRAYRGNIGYVRDAYTRTKSNNDAIGVELGFGSFFHAGGEYDYVNTTNTVHKWSSNNSAENTLSFKPSDAEKQMVYFKNPGEKAIISEDFYNAVGGDALVRLKLLNSGNKPIALPSLEVFDQKKIKQRDQELSYASKNARDKRTQVISYLNAEEAERVGLDKVIRAYPVNNFNVVNCENYRIIRRVSDQRARTEFYRKRNHISEITVLETDGKRYVYGIPVYNITQKDVTFSVGNTGGADGIVSHTGEENSKDNPSGSDHFYQSEVISPYAHSFLLTALLSPDYVDVKDDGITDDDLGDAVKFNYTRLNYTNGVFLNQKWRTPQAGNNSASFSEGLKTESQDNKGSYSYGERESWYVHSIESKNMIAVFYLGNRNDNVQPVNEYGSTASSTSIKKLDKIELYARSELVANSGDLSKLKPIKTVVFAYSYKLCKGSPLNSNATEGKLTLDSLWFTYNGNKQRRNIYRFAYDHNYDYKRNSQDKWGNYKNTDDNINPPGLSNADFPYPGYGNVPNRQKFNEYSSAWMLNKILLPSGSQMNIEYEADDYGFVQNRRACQMFQVAGFGSAPEQGYAPSKNLYGSMPATGNFRTGDHDYIFIDLAEDITSSDPATAKKEIYGKYLESLKQLILKLWIKMPADYQNASDFEPVTIFATIRDYGILPFNAQQSNKKRIWIRVNRVKNEASPMAATATQFLRDNFPAKAFPGNNVDPNASKIEQVVRALVGMAAGLQGTFSNFDRKARVDNLCMKVHDTKSFIRLTDPTLSRIGGGYRVKKVTIRDGWNKMTEKRDANGNLVEPGEHESIYGQEYDYSTEISVAGVKQKISSGVATYETQVGAEENPFKEVLNYENQNPAGPTQQGFIDMPFGETFFPAPMVGYGKVRVKSIHNKETKKIKSGVGTQETVFYTSKDFPYTADFTDFDPTSNVRYKSDPIMRFLKIDVKEMVTLSQGFRVVVNDMNGKIRSQASYPENDPLNAINYTEYFYRIQKAGENAYKLDNKLQVALKTGQIMSKEVGKDIEVMVDFREHRSETNSGGAHFNSDGFPLPPFPTIVIPVLFKPPMHDENTFRSVSVLKVVNEFGIVDSVVQVDKGSKVSTRNLVYDSETGDVLVSRTQNEFNYPVYNTNYPAYWAYTGMQPAYQNIDVVYSNVVFRNGFIESGHVNQNLFESGDEIYVNDLANTTGPANSAACTIVTGQSVLPKSNAFKIWALDIRKDDRSATATRKLIFIDRDGTPYNSKGASIRIIRSGKRNMLGASVSSFVSLTNPVKNASIQFNASDLVINSSAVEFKEKWRGEEAYYLVERQQLVKVYYPVRTAAAYSNGSMKAIQYKKNWDGSTFFALQENPPSVEARHFSYGKYSQGAWPKKHTYQDVRSWIKFDLSAVPADGIILDAKLNLYAYTAMHSNFAIPGEVIHGPNNPHQSRWLYGGTLSNAISLKRMYTPWAAVTNYNAWRYTNFGENQGYFPGDYAGGTGSDPAWPTMSYSLNPTDRRIDITNMFKNMFLDRDNPDHPTAFRMALYRFSWGGRVNEHRANFYNSGKPWVLPQIDYRYFRLSERYGLPGNPATPPPGQDVFITHEMGTTRTCYSVYSRLFMNPYCQGILGNWRSHRSNVFYGERKESDPTTATNIKTDGAIKDFFTFWSFSSNGLVKTNHPNWVWNTEITQFNRKGLEIENRDPLTPSRYNAGLYGYNDNLPIAVVNNSQVKESAFDGFEDYTYKDKICAGDCKTERENSSRHMKWTTMNGNVIDDNVSHTGRSSLKIAAGSYVESSHSLTASSTTVEPDLNINLVSSSYSVTNVNQVGTGLKAYYYWERNNLTTPFTTRIEPGINLWFGQKGNCNNNDNSQLPPNFTKCNDIAVIWKGKIVFPETGVYKFRFNVNDEAQLFLDGVAVSFPNCSGSASGYNYVTCNSVDLSRQKGQIQTIELRFKQWGGYGGVSLYWQQPGNGNWLTIPKYYLFPEGTSTSGAVTTQTYTCLQPEKIKVLANGLIDKFSPTPGKKMLLSAWVKQEGGAQVFKYDNNSIEVRFNGSSTATATFTPTGIIIEGWQRYEGVFEIPAGAVSIQVRLKNAHTGNVYFDDVRVHPYNANMKSFVYHPVTLRLMAEMDENNYSSFYEYDDDGTLIRVKKETREGVKTIKETRSAIQRNLQTIQ